MSEQSIQYGTPVFDKNGKSLGEVDHIIMDAWSGEPRKYVVRLADNVSAVYFKPPHVAEATEKQVKLNIAAEDMEST